MWVFKSGKWFDLFQYVELPQKIFNAPPVCLGVKWNLFIVIKLGSILIINQICNTVHSVLFNEYLLNVIQKFEFLCKFQIASPENAVLQGYYSSNFLLSSSRKRFYEAE